MPLIFIQRSVKRYLENLKLYRLKFTILFVRISSCCVMCGVNLDISPIITQFKFTKCIEILSKTLFIVVYCRLYGLK